MNDGNSSNNDNNDDNDNRNSDSKITGKKGNLLDRFN